MAAWIVAESLDQLLAQLNALAPRRSKVSDGSIGDEAHQKAGTSDHLPRQIAGARLVTARDFTTDPAGGLDCAKLRDALVRAKDPRVKYIIFNRQIISGAAGPQPWKARPYSGVNAHAHHLHLSVVADKRCRDSSPWLLPGLTSAVAPASDRPTIRRGDTGLAVELIQRFLGVVKPGEPGYSTFGPATEKAVIAYQRMRGLEPDGVCGPTTWAATGL